MVLSIVERGWRGARECSLALHRLAIPVTHLIKGYIGGPVRAMIQTTPLTTIVSVPRALFRVWLWGMLMWQTATGRLRWVLLDHERTLREISWWCRRFGVVPVMLQEHAQGYDLMIDRRRCTLEELVHRTP